MTVQEDQMDPAELAAWRAVPPPTEADMEAMHDAACRTVRRQRFDWTEPRDERDDRRTDE